MSVRRGLFAGDEERGKKDDDHRPTRSSMSPAAWSVRKAGQGLRKRRIVYILGAVLFIYLVFQNVNSGFGTNKLSDDANGIGSIRDTRLSKSGDPKTQRPPRPAKPSKSEEHYHDGPIKFWKLAASLHAAARLGGQLPVNKNVLFAASSLKSVAELVPLACEMARWERNDVHLAIMGREDTELEEIKKVNGAVEECNVHWHDARPDYSRWSTDFRMKVSVTASMEHIQTFIHPQIVIIDDPVREDGYFVEAMRNKVMDLGKSMIELPKNAAETMMWMTRLDSGSLAAWPTVYVDIFIQAPKQSSGALMRLLRSIEDADYFGTRRPHLTIELPADIDTATWQYLQNFVWPPLGWQGAPHASQVTIRHRIRRRTTTEEEASARLVESFYPVRTDASNVLLLSPQAELSPLYYHFLMYSLLEYKYSEFNRGSLEASRLAGISLHLPSTHPNDTLELHPPLKKPKKKSDLKDDIDDDEDDSKRETPFLWQIPSGNAVLYFGQKWMEFHSFITNRVSKPPNNHPRVFSNSHPIWLEHLLELMRSRGWYLMYPNFGSDLSLATLHSELYEAPEEHVMKKNNRRSNDPSQPDLNPNEPLTANEIPPQAPLDKERALISADLISLLPSSGDLPEVAKLPILSYEGNAMTFKDMEQSVEEFKGMFLRQIGTCLDGKSENPLRYYRADDLFCNLDDIYDHSALDPANSATGPVHPLNPEQMNIVYKDWQPDVFDGDSMTKEAVNEARSSEEVANHLSRQEGKKETMAAEPLPQNLPLSSSDVPLDPPNALAADGSLLSALPSLSNAQTANSDGSSADSSLSTSPSTQVLATHGTFNKETPKQPVEGEVAIGKGTGW